MKKQNLLATLWRYLLPVVGVGLIVLALAGLWEAAAALALLWFFFATGFSLVNFVRGMGRHRRGGGKDGEGAVK